MKTCAIVAQFRPVRPDRMWPTAAPLNPAYGASEFDFYLSDLDAKGLVVQGGARSPVVAVAQARGIPVIEIVPKLDGPAGLFDLPGTSAASGASSSIAEGEDIALVMHTSGSTLVRLKDDWRLETCRQTLA